jgi:2-polyprenyl-3-methyl-5-hydroxy-6-metoxy-1,4-benzoquinol methylase
MYDYLSKYYNRIFKFNNDIKTWIAPFTKKGGFAIDLGCGTGRLTHVLNDLGMKTIGIDLDSHMIDVAKHDYPQIDFKVENILDAFHDEKTYDLITCFGNTIVHLKKEELNTLFTYLQDKLSIHGYIIFQTLNYDHILEEKPSELKLIENDVFTFKRTYIYEEDHIVFGTVLNVEQKTLEGSTIIYPYTMNDFIHLAQTYDFNLTIYGDLVKNQLDNKANHIYYVFRF